MRKTIFTFCGVLFLGISIVSANPVSQNKAQLVAENFCLLNCKTNLQSIRLSYTGLSSTGAPQYYVFDINTNDGFVIVTAEDAAQPIIGYSTENRFVVPDVKSPYGIWLKKRGEEIDFIRTSNLAADTRISASWSQYSAPQSTSRQGNNSVSSVVVGPIVQSTWNQSPLYNALCPGGSVTGCVATAMAQIMRYWNYPAHGTGSSSYCDCTSQGFSQQYGTLSANYGATTYNWANMPLSLQNNNTDVATLNYQCGVSVHMDYSPSGSGAYVIAADNPVCAQNSYINYFGYDPSLIKGLRRSNYTDTAWIQLLKADLNLGRPVQYVGSDPNAGGHTWVCDGYDQNNFFHMNWGWGGASNGYFSINLLNPQGLNFSQWHEAVTGIVPIASVSLDAGVTSIFSPGGASCTNSFNPTIKLQNFGSTTMTSCTIQYQIDNNAVQSLNWNGSLVTGQFAVVSLPNYTAPAGTHTLVCSSLNPNGGTDGNSSNDQSANIFSVSLPGGILPVAEGFESIVLPSSDWDITHTINSDWSVTGNAAATGVKSCMIDNFSNTAGNASTLQTLHSYDLSALNSPALSFKVAYQEKNASNNDKLQVFVSTDCGMNWNSKWARYSSSLGAAQGMGSSPFVPTPAQFTTYTVNLLSVFSSTNALFKWVFYADAAGPGNNLYLDDINLFDAAPNAVQNISAAPELNIYPNPSSGEVQIGISLTEKHFVGVVVIDLMGRVVETIAPAVHYNGETVFTIGTKVPYRAGVYFVNIDIDGKKICRKVIIN